MNRIICTLLLILSLEACTPYISTTPKSVDQPTAGEWYARGVCYQKLNQLQPAIGDYQKAIAIHPDDADLYYNLGSIYWVLGEWQNVVEVWEKCLDLNPNHPRVNQYLSTARKKIH